MERQLSKDSKEQLAMALVFLKEWKCQSCDHFAEKIDMQIYVSELAAAIGVHDEWCNLVSKVAFTVKPRTE
jgi:hypothetical protein